MGKAYMTFNEVAINICDYLGDSDGTVLFSKVSRQLMHAIDQLNLNLFPSVGVEKIVVEDNLTAQLPEDFLAMVRIGICCEGSNELVPIDYNGDLCPIPRKKFTLDCCDCTKVVDDEGSLDEDASECCSACSISTDSRKRGIGGYNRDLSTYHYGYLYGFKSSYKNKGTYKIDELNNRLIFGSGMYVCPGSELIIEYSSANGAADYLRIPRQAMLTLQHKTAHLVLNNIQKREYERKMFRIEYRQLKSTLMRYTLEDFTNAVRSSYHSSIKG